MHPHTLTQEDLTCIHTNTCQIKSSELGKLWEPWVSTTSGCQKKLGALRTLSNFRCQALGTVY